MGCSGVGFRFESLSIEELSTRLVDSLILVERRYGVSKRSCVPINVARRVADPKQLVAGWVNDRNKTHFLAIQRCIEEASIAVSRTMSHIQLSRTARVRYGDQTMSSLTDTRLSEEVFLALPESSTPMELLDGELVMAPSPHFLHQKILTRMVSQLLGWSEGKPFTVALAPLDVRLSPGRIVQPDGMVFSPALPNDTPTPIVQIPLVCIEVLSSNRAYDRVTKRYVYAEAGVAEYWIVDTAGTIERRHGPGLSSVEFQTDRLESPLLEGLVLELSTLFGE